MVKEGQTKNNLRVWVQFSFVPGRCGVIHWLNIITCNINIVDIFVELGGGVDDGLI